MKPIPTRPADAAPRDLAEEERQRIASHCYFYSSAGRLAYGDRSVQEIWDNGGEPPSITPWRLGRYPAETK